LLQELGKILLEKLEQTENDSLHLLQPNMTHFYLAVLQFSRFFYSEILIGFGRVCLGVAVSWEHLAIPENKNQKFNPTFYIQTFSVHFLSNFHYYLIKKENEGFDDIFKFCSFFGYLRVRIL
jgi:hypothetical protein